LVPVSQVLTRRGEPWSGLSAVDLGGGARSRLELDGLRRLVSDIVRVDEIAGVLGLKFACRLDRAQSELQIRRRTPEPLMLLVWLMIPKFAHRRHQASANFGIATLEGRDV
jgi:hypothetical protein